MVKTRNTDGCSINEELGGWARFRARRQIVYRLIELAPFFRSASSRADNL
jgi:hypothetical protein